MWSALKGYKTDAEQLPGIGVTEQLTPNLIPSNSSPLGSAIKSLTGGADRFREARLERMADLAKLQQQQAASVAQSASNAALTSGFSGGGGAVGPGKIVNSIMGKQNLSTIKFGKGSTLVNSQYAQQFQGLVNDLERAGYRIDTGLGYQNRNVAGTNKPSKHAGGYAIDINPGLNPFSTSGKTQFDKNVLHQIMAKYPDLIWGGDWQGAKKDSMHFSVRQKIPGYSTY